MPKGHYLRSEYIPHELIENIMVYCNLNYEDAVRVIKTIAKVMGNFIKSGQGLTIKGFGSWKLKKPKVVPSNLPYKYTEGHWGRKTKVKFTPSKHLKSFINLPLTLKEPDDNQLSGPGT